MERLVFPFEFTHDRKGIAKDREKIFEFAQTLMPGGKVSNGEGGRGLFLKAGKQRSKRRDRKRRRGEGQDHDGWLRASELPQPMPPTHFLRIAGQSAREVADDGSTEGGITESLVTMNGKVTEDLMTSSMVIANAMRMKARNEQITYLYLACFAREPNKAQERQCRAALNGGLDLGDIVWALVNSREFIFIQ